VALEVNRNETVKFHEFLNWWRWMAKSQSGPCSPCGLTN